jgi:hypothetical protein
VVTDDHGSPSNPGDDFNPAPVLSGSHNVGDTNTNDQLDTDETWQYAASRPVSAGQYTNTATAEGQDAADARVSDTDLSNHFGLTPGIALQKATNGFDADTPATAPEVYAGTTVNFTYTVSNTGGVPLSDVEVVDDAGTPADATDDFFATYDGGDANGDDVLDLTEVWAYSASRMAVEGVYRNTAAVTATTPAGAIATVSDSDPSGYTGLPAPPIVSKRRFLASS